MARLLAIDTSGDACSVALSVAGNFIEKHVLAPRQQGQMILPMIQEILAEAELALSQLDAIAFGRGPGSFTGVRLCASVVQGLAFPYDLPVIPISCLAALAQSIALENISGDILAVMDARKHEIYSCQYRHVSQALTPETVGAPEKLSIIPCENLIIVGNGNIYFSDELIQEMIQEMIQGKVNATSIQRFPEKHTQARDIAALALLDYQTGKILPAHEALPVYVRDKVVD